MNFNNSKKNKKIILFSNSNNRGEMQNKKNKITINILKLESIQKLKQLDQEDKQILN